MQVYRSMIIDAEIDRVWEAVRAFDGVARWNPGVLKATLETGSATASGTIRRLDIPDGSVFRETLLAHSDLERFYTYDILDSPLPVSGYISTHRFLPITRTGQTLGIWESRFDCAPQVADAMEKTVGDAIYIGGMSGLNDFLQESRHG
ncbi:SRPBCC family protein [uncultured Lentibacter sp.]|uniref:SRPBCC family protein n=1 Tax=uncultured Lentibacter sp. TaxID=1659309 RepID=UPI0026227287|nr:SRPBCC family protein [uncultured Lentibacter sp.]MCW1955156.1 SRPBCC family protein [Roseobacter sp.]